MTGRVGSPGPAGPSEPARTAPDGAVLAARWREQAHLASPAHPPQLEAVREARRFVSAALDAVGLDGCAADAGLLVSELAANAVLHARTPFTVHLRPTLEGGVRLEVEDASPLPPVLAAPSASATSGRGLDLVASLATRWGSHPLEPGEGGAPTGKVVWCEVDADGAPTPPELDTAQLLALWSDEVEHADPDGRDARGPREQDGHGGHGGHGGEGGRSGFITTSMPAVEALVDVLVPELPVAALLAAKEGMDDQLRELQLVLLATPATGTPVAAPPADGSRARRLEVAGRLDAAARGFEVGRRQVREQASRAAARGEARVRLHLRLPASAHAAAVEYRSAVAAASALAGSGALLSAQEGAGTGEPARVRSLYLDAVIDQLAASGPARG